MSAEIVAFPARLARPASGQPPGHAAPHLEDSGQDRLRRALTIATAIICNRSSPADSGFIEHRGGLRSAGITAAIQMLNAIDVFRSARIGHTAKRRQPEATTFTTGH